MALDRAMIHGRLDIIERNLRFLAEYQAMAAEDFVRSYRDIQAVKYSLLEIIEACIDIASHVLIAEGFERAESYAEMFEILAKRQILSADLAAKLADMSRFRNLLVHSYAKVDDIKVLAFLKAELADVRAFSKAILKRVDREEKRLRRNHRS